jgi:hypothetical protein
MMASMPYLVRQIKVMALPSCTTSKSQRWLYQRSSTYQVVKRSISGEVATSA